MHQTFLFNSSKLFSSLPPAKTVKRHCSEDKRRTVVVDWLRFRIDRLSVERRYKDCHHVHIQVESRANRGRPESNMGGVSAKALFGGGH